MRVATLVLALGLMVALATCTYAQSSSSFTGYDVSGISMSPGTFCSGIPSYTVYLAPGASLYVDKTIYAITQIVGFYAVGDGFTATGNDLFDGDWKWTMGTNPQYLAGWSEKGKDKAITPGASKTFSFASLSVNNVPPAMGLHVVVAPGVNGASPFAGGYTGYIIPHDVSSPVPEPGTIVAALSILGPVGFVFRRKR